MSLLLRLHREEEGMEALQAILVLAVAIIILALLRLLLPFIQEWLVNALKDILNWETWYPPKEKEEEKEKSDTGGALRLSPDSFTFV